jgi:VanZ family protein
MIKSRIPSRSILLLCLVSTIVIAAHLIPGLDTSAIHRDFRDALHVLGFALVAAIIVVQLPGSARTAGVTTLLLIILIAALSELSQSLVGKQPDLKDCFRDIAGAILYLCARALWQRGSTAATGLVLRTMAVVLAALILAPLARILFIAQLIHAGFPTILDFDGRFDAHFFFPVYADVRILPAPAAPSVFANRLAEIDLLRRGWSGIRIEPLVRDWSGYEYLSLSAQVVNGADNSRVDVHVSDGVHPGYRTQHWIGGALAGSDPITVRLALKGIVDTPGRPELDRSNVIGVYIIGNGKRDGAILQLDNIRLE